MNQYETTIIMTPILSEDEVKQTVKTYRDFITEKEGEMVHEENWGLRQLAYPIQKKTTGIYHLFEFKAPGALIDPMELQLKRDDRIIRFLTVKLDKYGIDYNERRRKGEVGPNRKKKENQETEESQEA